jgi:hypothetical protein
VEKEDNENMAGLFFGNTVTQETGHQFHFGYLSYFLRRKRRKFLHNPKHCRSSKVYAIVS